MRCFWSRIGRRTYRIVSIARPSITQRGVVQNERRQGENRPYGIVQQLIADATLAGTASIFVDSDRVTGRSECGVA